MRIPYIRNIDTLVELTEELRYKLRIRDAAGKELHDFLTDWLEKYAEKEIELENPLYQNDLTHPAPPV